MKISIIMQSYLGEYPGSRADSDKKFLRAVQSFIDQTNKDTELVIVSDCCDITHKLYYEYFKEDPRIKYVYVDKSVPNMYEGEEKYYRGLPREAGRAVADGDIITYMDSDDYLLSNSLKVLKDSWERILQKQPETKWCINNHWIDNGVAQKLYVNNSSVETWGNLFTVDGLDSEWIICKMRHPTLVVCTPWLTSHVSSITTKWEDTQGGESEDVHFSKRMRKEGKGALISEPLYVRCHYSNAWDY